MKRLIPLGYLIAIILLLSSIIYFFAANWPALSRSEKLTLAICAMIVFYAVSFLTRKWLPQQPFLAKWILVAGAITFGISVALIGQIYNSHADSYLLFIIWLLPTLLFAFTTNYTPFWVISYVLFHLSYWFYLHPSSYAINRSELEEWFIYLVLMLINLILFILAASSIFPNRIIRVLAYTGTHFGLIVLSIFELFEPYSGWTNILYILFVIASYYFLAKKNLDKLLSIILFTMGSIYICTKIAEMPFLFGSDLGFLALQVIGSVLALVLIIGGVILAKKLIPKNSTESWAFALKNTLIVIVTLIGSGIFVSSFGSIIYFLFESEYAFVFFSLLFILFGLFVKKLDPVARHTIVVIGFFSGLAEAIFLEIAITILYFVISIIVTIIMKDSIVRFISYSTAIGCLLSLLFDHLELSYAIGAVFLVTSALNFLVFYLCRKYEDIQRISFFHGFIFLYATTFLDNSVLNEISYTALMAAVIIYSLFIFSKNGRTFLFRLTVIFSFALLISSYYDFVWSLLHKSMSLFIISIFIFALTILFDKKEGKNEDSFFTKKKAIWMIAIMLLQIGILSAQIFTNEALIKNGKQITLSLAPVDPRSFIQGDYVQLQYEIGQVEMKDVYSNRRVYVLVKKDSDGIYRREKIITEQIDPKNAALEEDEAFITGRYNGYNSIIFGIESYFVPEGTGIEVQNEAKLAEVVVSENGNALLLSVD